MIDSLELECASFRVREEVSHLTVYRFGDEDVTELCGRLDP